jgi:hypothetical protein
MHLCDAKNAEEAVKEEDSAVLWIRIQIRVDLHQIERYDPDPH